MGDEINDIKREHISQLRNKRAVLIIEEEDGFSVEEWTPDGVWPSSSYRTRRETGARVLQLLGIKEGPIYPQSWPEEAGIG